jgi:DNA-binding transcriptional regulator YiaG
MEVPNERPPLADQIKQGLEDAILCARGELELRTTVVEVAPRPMSPPEIIRLRESLGLDRRAFALALDVTESTLRSWERGDRSPSATSLGRLHKVKAEAETSMRRRGDRKQPAGRLKDTDKKGEDS